MTYEKLLQKAHHHEIDIYEKKMPERIKGLYADNVICINSKIKTSTEKACILAEELGHHHTSSGDILNQTNLLNRKQERRARKWAWNKLVTPKKLITAFEAGCRSKYEIADFLSVTEEFLEEGLKFYREKHGTEIQVNEKYTLYLDPLAVFKSFE